MFRAKSELGQNDVLVVRSDDYGPHTPASSLRPGSRNDADADAADRIEDRDVLAVINSLSSQGGNGCAEIVLEDGSTWLASSMANGSFEFTHIDSRGCTKTARWARRRPAPWMTGTAPAGSPTPQPPPPEPWWTFSVMDPESKRHPVMGSLTPDSVELYDTYNTLSASSGRYPLAALQPRARRPRLPVGAPAGEGDCGGDAGKESHAGHGSLDRPAPARLAGLGQPQGFL